ncbi:MAG: hypothetical protein L0338_19320, partial [Acidobacteria bacterium]|nr:hypothetical protein [Acidobacteriota bacterium]
VSIDVLEDRIKLMTLEVEERQQGNTELIFEFSYDFDLLLAKPGDSYWNLHRVLEQEGKVQHSASNCPDRKNLPMPREWHEGRWHDLTSFASSSRRAPGE